MNATTSNVVVVVPVFNEGRVIARHLTDLFRRGFVVVAVDDGSRDDTWAALGALPVHALRHRLNLGQGAALQTGMAYALTLGASYVVHFDADGQHRVGDIDTLVAPLVDGSVDVVLGSRFIRADDSRRVPASRRFLLRCGVWFNFVLTGVKLTDAHNGFRALNRRAVEAIELRENRFAHASEILGQIRKHRLRYVEKPVTIDYSDYSREKGQSGWNAIKIVIDLLIRRLFR